MRRRTLTPGNAGDKPLNTSAGRGFIKALAVDILARTLWGEARGEGPKGMHAVCNVILNRAALADDDNNPITWWGIDLVTICQKPYQFSCWNPDDPNRAKLMAVDEGNADFATALRIARRAVYGQVKDITGGATHYHADHVHPYWADNKISTAQIGQHIFYRIVG